MKALCNLDRHPPLANHGSNCTGWYVTVNITCNSQKSQTSPYRALMRHSLTLLHFIVHRRAGVLCSDSQSCCQGSDWWILMKSLENLILARWLNTLESFRFFFFLSTHYPEESYFIQKCFAFDMCRRFCWRFDWISEFFVLYKGFGLVNLFQQFFLKQNLDRFNLRKDCLNLTLM